MDTLGLQLGIVQRSQGQDARGLAAYQLCARIETPSRAFDFSRKVGERIGGTVMLPKDAPGWASDPAALWMRAEEAERRGDAQVARTGIISIPREVPPDQRLAFAIHLTQPYVDRGMAVQVDVHAPPARDGAAQPHAHLLMTMRPFDGIGFSARKERTWNQAFRDLSRVREEMATRANAWMQECGISTRLDHRARADRGDEAGDLPPEPSIPRSAWNAYRRNAESHAAAPVRTLLAARAAAREGEVAGAEVRAITSTVRRRYETAREALWKQFQEEQRVACSQVAKARAAAERAARSEDRRRQWEERAALNRAIRRSLIIALFASPARQAARHKEEAHRARVAAYRARWTAPAPDVPWKEWIAARAARGDDDAAHVARAMERAAARSRRGDPARTWIASEEQAVAEAVKIATGPSPRTAEVLFEKEATYLTRRRDDVRRAAEEARSRAEEARDRAGFPGVLFGTARGQEAVRLTREAQIAERKASWAGQDREAGLRAAEQAAEEVAREDRERSADAERSPEVRALRRREKEIAAVAVAVAAQDEATVAAAREGDLDGATKAASGWQERASVKEQERAEKRRQEAVEEAKSALAMKLGRSPTRRPGSRTAYAPRGPR